MYTGRIKELKEQLGKELTIMGHHYQGEAVIQHTDLRGDSLELARQIANITSEHIVFCGVYFMAESAALLARNGQKIYLPDHSADCSMALMAPASTVENALVRLSSGSRKVIPLAYVNSSLAVKHIVGKFGGAVCTSANAETMMKWAQKQGDAVLFLPDKNLGRNVAKKLGVPESEWLTLNIRNAGNFFDLEAAHKSTMLFWPGVCCIHEKFDIADVKAWKDLYPQARVIVHPESSPEVVDMADEAGSTSFIIKYVEQAEEGAIIVIGTELNLVNRLAEQHKDRLRVFPLLSSECASMAKITEEKLFRVLKEITCSDTKHQILIDKEMVENARLSLERMLEVCAK